MKKLVESVDKQTDEDIDKITDDLQGDIREQQGLEREIDFDKKINEALSDIK